MTNRDQPFHLNISTPCQPEDSRQSSLKRKKYTDLIKGRCNRQIKVLVKLII